MRWLGPPVVRTGLGDCIRRGIDSRWIRFHMGSNLEGLDHRWYRASRDSSPFGVESSVCDRVPGGSIPDGGLLGDSIPQGIDSRGQLENPACSPEEWGHRDYVWFSGTRAAGGDVCQCGGLDPCSLVQSKDGIQLVAHLYVLCFVCVGVACRAVLSFCWCPHRHNGITPATQCFGRWWKLIAVESRLRHPAFSSPVACLRPLGPTVV